ncbi:MAG: leucine-rich repeat protein [Lachnospiraceae bacterium]|nr:leucine-rich repeat protein [Lachnospiraceae bacterium]
MNIGAGRYTVCKSNTVRYDGPTNPNATTVTIPNTVTVNGKAHKVTSIKEKAFSKNKKVKKITIGKYVKGIGKYAFYRTTNLRKLVIKSKSIKSVGKNAFKKAGYKKGKKLVVDVPNSKIGAYRSLFQKRKLYASVKIK